MSDHERSRDAPPPAEGGPAPHQDTAAADAQSRHSIRAPGTLPTPVHVVAAGAPAAVALLAMVIWHYRPWLLDRHHPGAAELSMITLALFLIPELAAIAWLTAATASWLDGGEPRPSRRLCWLAAAGGIAAFPVLVGLSQAESCATDWWWRAASASALSARAGQPWWQPPPPTSPVGVAATVLHYLAETPLTAGLPLWILIGVPVVLFVHFRRPAPARRPVVFYVLGAACIAAAWALCPSRVVEEWLRAGDHHPAYVDGLVLWQLGTTWLWGCCIVGTLLVRRENRRRRSCMIPPET